MSDINYISKLDEIAKVLVKNKINNKDIGLMGGMTGIVLFLFYYSEFSEQKKYKETAEKYLIQIYRNINKNPSKYSLDYAEGISGLYSTLIHLEKNNFINGQLYEYDEIQDQYIYRQCMKYIEDSNIDFFYGAGGLLHYLYICYKHKKKGNTKILINSIVNALYNNYNNDCGIFSLPNFPVDQVEISMPHGISSWIIILSKIKMIGIQNENIDSILTNLYLYYRPFIENISTKNEYLFPEIIYLKNDYKLIKYYSRLGWCYGDIPCLLAILNYAEAIDNLSLKNKIIFMLENVADRRLLETNNIYDACLCHGSSGLSIIYNKLHLKFNNEVFEDCSNYWNNISLSFSNLNNGLAGFLKTYKVDGNMIYSQESGFLEGIAGIGLSLMTSLSKKNNSWSELLLI